MFLASTSDIIRVVTGSAVSTIGVHADWVDNATGTYTPGRTNTNITTATTTTVVAAPAASTVRNVRGLTITNNHATASCVITPQHFDGTNSINLPKLTLKSGEKLDMDEDGGWRHLASAGAEYEYQGPAIPNLGITGTVAETCPRNICSEANTGALTSGTLRLQAIFLKADQVVTNISFFSATTAAGTPTNQFFALYGLQLELLAQSNNDTTTAWAANTIKTLAMQTAFVVPKTGHYLVGIMVAATTVPTLKGPGGNTGGTLQSTAFNLPTQGNFTSGLSTVLPSPAAGPSGGSSTAPIWAAIT